MEGVGSRCCGLESVNLNESVREDEQDTAALGSSYSDISGDLKLGLQRTSAARGNRSANSWPDNARSSLCAAIVSIPDTVHVCLHGEDARH